MEEKKNVNEWHAVERVIFDAKEYHFAALDDDCCPTEVERCLEAEYDRSKQLVSTLYSLGKFLDCRELRRIGNPYAGNWLLVRYGNGSGVVDLARRFNDIVPLRYRALNTWFYEDEYPGGGKGRAIDSIIDANGRLLIRDATYTLEDLAKPESNDLVLEVRQLTDKGAAMIDKAYEKWPDGTGNADDYHYSLCEWPDWMADDLAISLEELWDDADLCQRPQYLNRQDIHFMFEFERELDGKMQSVRIKEGCGVGGKENKTFLVLACYDGHSIDRFDTLDDALAFCKERYGIEVDD